MGSGSSRLTKEQCKQRVTEDKWEESWDEFYFAEGKSVSSELAERVWCKAERWAAYIAANDTAEPKNDGESPSEEAQPGASGEAAAAADAVDATRDDLVACKAGLQMAPAPAPGAAAEAPAPAAPGL